MEPEIIHEDKSLLVLNKPAGWIVNEAQTTTGQPVVQKWLDGKFDYPLSHDAQMRSGVVHRIDKETSGILLVAKTKEAFAELQRQFKSREVEKTYLALVHGKLEPKVGEIKTTVGRLPWRRDRFGIVAGGRESETKYNVINYYEMPKAKDHLKYYSLVEFYPKTGRTHQIRVHAKYLGHPLVSDDFYTGRKTARADRKWCSHLFLLAKAISFTHPTTQAKVDFNAGTPKVLTNALHNLEKLG